jgi:predicted DCC family thiol-disulfide oxidoreductase YuxK
MNRKLLYCFFLSVTQIVVAQQIEINLPAHKGQQLTVALKYGTRSDTIYHAALDDSGRAKIVLPKEHRGYRGMATMKTGEYAIFDFIVAGEDFALSCTEEYPHGANVTFSGSSENASLQSEFIAQHRRRVKLDLLDELLSNYDEADWFRPELTKEYRTLQSVQSLFERELRESPLYAAKFIRYYNFMNREVGNLLLSNPEQMAQVRTYVCDSLDVDGLFTSGLWFGTLNGLLALYDEGTPYHSDFIKDMSLLLKRASTDRIYAELAENLFAICESTGWGDLEEQLAYFLINDGRIGEPSGRLKMLMTLFKLSKGNRVPKLTFGALPKGKVALVFYETGCTACANEIEQLKSNYSLLQERGYEVVSIAADRDQQVFESTSESFPWKAKYCNYRGFEGDDFKNFGVIGTPTFYLINEKGILQGRFARMEDVLKRIIDN